MFRRLETRPSCRAGKKSRRSSLAVFSRGRTSGKAAPSPAHTALAAALQPSKGTWLNTEPVQVVTLLLVERRWLTTSTQAQPYQTGELWFKGTLRPPTAADWSHTVFPFCGTRPLEPFRLAQRALPCSCSGVLLIRFTESNFTLIIH